MSPLPGAPSSVWRSVSATESAPAGGQLYRVVVERQGLSPSTWDGCICVNMNGERFGDEYASNHSNEGYEAQDKFVSSALGSAILDKGTDHTRRVGGPIWAIFDQSFADSERFELGAPYVDEEHGYFFRGETLEELAQTLLLMSK